LFRADLSARPAAAVVRAAIASDDGRCSARESLWRHATGVAGARFALARGGAAFTVRAEEEATYSAAVYDAASLPDREDLLTTPTIDGWGPATTLSASGALRPYRTMAFRLGAPLAAGTYVYAARVTAVYNPERSSLFVSRPFTVR
jgi:hypothetical protein